MAKPVQNNNYLILIVSVVLSFILGVFVGPTIVGSTKTQSTVVSQSKVSDLVNFVDGAANQVANKGEEAFADFRQEGGTWKAGDWYIFAYDMQGMTLVLPPTPEVEGTSRWNTKDSNGVYFVREMATQLGNKDAAWVMYSYPKPGETEASPKLAYVKKVKLGNKYIFVGSGMYY